MLWGLFSSIELTHVINSENGAVEVSGIIVGFAGLGGRGSKRCSSFAEDPTLGSNSDT